MLLNVNQIREALAEQMAAVRNGSADLKKSKEIRALSAEYCKTIKMELGAYKDAGRKPDMSSFLPLDDNNNETRPVQIVDATEKKAE